MANILYVTNSSKPGGMEKHVLELISGMSKSKHNVYVWCPSGPLSMEYEKAGAQITLKHINYDIDPFYIRDLVNFIKAKDIAIVHGHELKAATNSIGAAFLAGVKVRISHTHTPISTWKVSRLKKILTVFGYSLFVNLFATCEIALTESIKKTKIKEGIFEKKLKVIPNGINFELFQLDNETKKEYREEIYKKYNIPENSFVLGNLSRLTIEKGYNLLIEAFSRLAKHEKYGGNVFLLIGGGGTLLDDYKKLIKDYNLDSKVVITGIFDESEKVKFQSAIDLLVFPSLAEGFGYVVVEAMAFGIPVLASDLLVLKDVGGDTTHFFKNSDSANLYNRILDLLSSWEETKKLTYLAKERVKNNYTLEKFWDSYNNLYKLYL